MVMTQYIVYIYCLKSTKLLIHHCTCFALKFKFAVASVVATVHPSFLHLMSSIQISRPEAQFDCIQSYTHHLLCVVFLPPLILLPHKPTICYLNLTADSYPTPPFLIITLWTINSSPTCCTLTSTSFKYFATAV